MEERLQFEHEKADMTPDNDPRETLILSERARQLAKEADNGDAPNDGVHFVEFHIGEEYYGIELAYIREVYVLKGLTYLPGVPPFVRGIINVRGTIVSVIDLRQVFGLDGTEATEGKPVIILASEKMEFGVLADRINGVRRMPESELQPPVPTLPETQSRCLKGIADGRVAILDGRKLLEDGQLQIHPGRKS